MLRIARTPRYAFPTLALVLAIVVALAAAGHYAGARTGRETFNVSATDLFTQTGYALEKGHEYLVKASGKINYCSGAPQCDATPDGSVSGEAHCGTAGGASALCGQLIGHVGDHAFPLGRKVRFTAHESGDLALGIQDFDVTDNTGSFRLTIEEAKHSSIEGRITDEYGQGVMGAPVTAKGPADTESLTVRYGLYSIWLEAQDDGRYVVKPAGPGKFKPAKREVTIERPGQKVKHVDFTQVCDDKRGRVGKFGSYLPGDGFGGLYFTYSCTSKKATGRYVVNEFECADGTQWPGLSTGSFTPEVNVAADGSFDFEGRGVDQPAVRLQMTGRFTGPETADVTMVISFFSPATDAWCTQARRSQDMRLVKDD